MATSTIEKEIIEREKQFWDAIQKNDAKAAGKLTADDSILVGAQGAGMMQPADFAGMMEHAPYELKKYTMDDDSFLIKSIGDDVAIVAYKVREDLTVDGKSIKMEASDSSVWVRRDGKWLCALHTESISGDPYGRDRQPLEK